MQVRLLITQGKASVREVVLRKETLIGRCSDCHLKIASTEVSRKHCLIRLTSDQVLVRDLGSANGTQVNGKTVAAETDVPLTPGDRLSIGPLKFTVLFDQPARPPRPVSELVGDPKAAGKEVPLAVAQEILKKATALDAQREAVPVFAGPGSVAETAANGAFSAAGHGRDEGPALNGIEETADYTPAEFQNLLAARGVTIPQKPQTGPVSNEERWDLLSAEAQPADKARAKRVEGSASKPAAQAPATATSRPANQTAKPEPPPTGLPSATKEPDRTGANTGGKNPAVAFEATLIGTLSESDSAAGLDSAAAGESRSELFANPILFPESDPLEETADFDLSALKQSTAQQPVQAATSTTEGTAESPSEPTAKSAEPPKKKSLWNRWKLFKSSADPVSDSENESTEEEPEAEEAEPVAGVDGGDRDAAAVAETDAGGGTIILQPLGANEEANALSGREAQRKPQATPAAEESNPVFDAALNDFLKNL